MSYYMAREERRQRFAEKVAAVKTEKKARKERVRARTKDGEFKADDPRTPLIDEAWIDQD